MTIFYQYAYFIGCVILFFVWLTLFYYRKDLQKEMFFGSLIAMPIGASEIMHSEYWNPPSVFNLIDKIGFGIEDFLFAFFVGGIASILYEIISRKKERKEWFNRKMHFLPYILFFILFIGLDLLFPLKTIFNLSASLLLIAVMMGYVRKDLMPQIIFSGTYFAAIYFILFFIFLKFFYGYVEAAYNLKNILGIYIKGVPIEEIIFAFAFGACWSVLYEYIRGYKTKPINFFDKLKNYAKN